MLQIPKNLKMMYVHGYQSYLWNTVLSERIRSHGCSEPIAGDVVYLDRNATVSDDVKDETVVDEATVAPAATEEINAAPTQSQW